ncbi:hypothetical protein ACFQRL_11110 [Microbacterium fluvii]|uniref:Uncharacterized protein n=1 Tax=Microbacterium fluvii TaxID=415215 RepID=A0ABW2HG57_9MICO|nr:hypothetical protein [Microbacterium fluvii]MCU4673143.1 hypothetical protein [Microbacterium fluvii]
MRDRITARGALRSMVAGLSAVLLAAVSIGGTAAAAGAAVAHTGTQYTLASDSSVRWWVPSTLVEGEDLVISGSGWLNTAGTGGSTVALKFDDGASATTTLQVINPFTDTVFANKTVFGIAQADAAGDWQLRIPYLTLANSNQQWKAGQTHSITLLSGSLQTPAGTDRARTTAPQPASFTITAATPDPEPTASPTPTATSAPSPEPSATTGVGEPAWAHTTITAGTATAWVQSEVAAGTGGTLRISGVGWKSAAGGSTVAVKLNSAPGVQYTRSGAGIVQHPSASGDDTIWALLAPSDPDDHANVYVLAADGSFDITIDAPAGLTAGQYLTVQLQSGRFDSGDVQRSVVSSPLTVGGVAYQDPDDGELPTCVATSSAPTVTIENATVSLGGVLHVSGTGWCHPATAGGGSVIGVKIDEGAYSRLSTDVHSNKTIWAVIEADDDDGTFSVDIALPDGTTAGANGSSPAFTQGSHTLRLLSGSLKAGDTVRTLASAAFTVGAYAPNGAPDPIDRATLTSANRAGVTARLTSTALEVTVPGAHEGDWVFLTPFATDGSPRYPWLDTWFRTDATGTASAPLAGVTLPTGTIAIAVQSGQQADSGALIGWASVTVPTASAPNPTPTPAPTDGTAAADEGDGATPTTTSRPFYTLSTQRTQQTAPTSVPAAPFSTSAGLVAGNAGGVTLSLDGSVATLVVPAAQPGEWVFVFAYSEPTPVGWIQVDAERAVRVDVAALEAGDHKIAIVAADEQLLGWAGVTVDGVLEEQPAATTEHAAADVSTDAGAEAPAALTATGGLSSADWWLLGGGALLAGVLVAVVLVVRSRRARAGAEQ